MLSNFAGDIENQYDINPEELNHGSFGYVNEGYRKSDHKHVAVKTLIDDLIDMDLSISLLRELQILANIKHPKCLQLLAFSLDPPPKIVTPFMAHGSLEQHIHKLNRGKPDKAFTPTKMMCALYGICSTMQFLHDKSIIHRDFKPANVFLDENYDICIADFGLSRKVEENLFLTRANIGSPIYMAPELFTEDYKTYTNKIDVFSFGVSYLQFFGHLTALDDGLGKIQDEEDLYTRVGDGARFLKPKGANDEQYQIYIRCCDNNPDLRPSFKELCDIFETQKGLWFKGVDEEEYKEYIENCKEIDKSFLASPASSTKPAPVSKSKTKHKRYDLNSS